MVEVGHGFCSISVRTFDNWRISFCFGILSQFTFDILHTPAYCPVCHRIQMLHFLELVVVVVVVEGEIDRTTSNEAGSALITAVEGTKKKRRETSSNTRRQRDLIDTYCYTAVACQLLGLNLCRYWGRESPHHHQGEKTKTKTKQKEEEEGIQVHHSPVPPRSVEGARER